MKKKVTAEEETKEFEKEFALPVEAKPIDKRERGER